MGVSHLLPKNGFVRTSTVWHFTNRFVTHWLKVIRYPAIALFVYRSITAIYRSLPEGFALPDAFDGDSFREVSSPLTFGMRQPI
jgi:hypothetical protein